MTDHDEELAALRAEYEARLERLDLYYQKQIEVLRACGADVRRERDDARATLAKLRAELAAAVDALRGCLDALECVGETGHYCGRCDEAVDRNGEVRDAVAGIVADYDKGATKFGAR